MQHLQMNYVLRVDAPVTTRNQLTMLFASDQARQWWAKVRADYTTEAASRRARRFVSLADEVVAQAAMSKEAVERALEEPPPG